jgi:hypothetical protein
MPVSEDKRLPAACARILHAIYAQEFLACSDGYRPERGTGEAVHDLPSSASLTEPWPVPLSGSIGAAGNRGVSAGSASPSGWTPSP